MDTIVCLVGESGLGKTEIVKQLGYNVIQSYTTRIPRKEGEWGHTYVNDRDYLFKDDGRIFDYDNNCYLNVIAYTYYDGDYYWATKEQYRDKGISIYVVDPAGVKVLKQVIDDAKLIIIHLKVDEKVRWDRMYERENYNTDKIHKINQRIEHDKKAFQLIECDYVIDNNGKPEKTIKIIKELLR